MNPLGSQLKTVAKKLTPPLIWDSARSVVHMARSRKLPPAESGEQRAAWYDRVYYASEEYRKHYSASCYYFLWCVIVDRIMRAEISSVLDIGCGPGQFAMFLRDKGLKQYCGLDFSEESIRLAKSVCPQFQFVAADVFETDLVEQSDYEAVVSLEFLEHVQDDLCVLERIRAGAKLYATVPSFPEVGHVRHFSSCSEVSERYGGMFGQVSVDCLLSPDQGKRYYLFEGTRL